MHPLETADFAPAWAGFHFFIEGFALPAALEMAPHAVVWPVEVAPAPASYLHATRQRVMRLGGAIFAEVLWYPQRGLLLRHWVPSSAPPLA